MSRKHLIRTNRRAGFTLVEILVVIAIIAVLASLILGGVMVALNKGPEASNRNDILQLSTALEKFKTKYGCFPPNTIRLRSNLAAYSAPPNGTNPAPDALDASSVAWLSTIWPNLQPNVPAAGLQWAGATAMPAAGFVLDGDQCLVFFLGGIPGVPLPGTVNVPLQGFSTDPTNPASLTGDRIKMLDFDGARIQLAKDQNGVLIHGATNPFPSFMDAYKTMPFIYFSSTNASKKANGYDPPGVTNMYGVSPYLSATAPTNLFYNPNTFQIISAGRDMKFGATPAAPWTAANTPVAGNDDMSNFSGSLLGVGP